MTHPFVDVETELDVLTAVVRAPYRAADTFRTVDARLFGYAPHRMLWQALGAVPWPAARWEPETGWRVAGLEDQIARIPNAGSPARLAGRLYAALEDPPLLPFGARVLDRLRELAHRRRWHTRATARFKAAELDVTTAERIARILAEYVTLPLDATVIPLEWALDAELDAELDQ